MLFIEAVGKAAPAHIAGKGFLFFRRRQPVFLLDPLQGADGGHIGRMLFRLAAHAQRPICDAEVMPLLGWYLRVERCKAHTLLYGLRCGEIGFLFGGYFRPGYLHFCFCGRFRLHFWFLWRQFGRKIIRPTFAGDHDRNTERFQLALHRFQRRDRKSGHQIGAASAADSTFRCGISELVMQCLGILFKRLVEISNLYQYQRIRILCAQCGILLPNRACLCHWHLQRFFKAKHGIGAVQIGPHGFQPLLPQVIVPVVRFRGFPCGEHILINFLHPVSVQKLCGHSFDALPIVCNGVLGKRPHHILRRIHEEIYDLPGQLFPLIFRHGRPVGIGEEFVLGDQFSDAFGRLRPFQRDLGIGGRDTAVTELDALATDAGNIVISAAVTAVLAVIILEVFFPLGLILVGGVKSVHAETVVGASTALTQHLVDLVGGNKKLPVGSKPVGNGKMQRLSLKVTEPLQYLFRTVAPETQQVLPGVQRIVERSPLIHAFLQGIRLAEKAIDLLLHFRIAALDGMGQHGLRQKARFPCFLRYVPAGIGDAVRQLHPLVMLDFIQFALRHIPPQIQQLPDALRCFLP